MSTRPDSVGYARGVGLFSATMMVVGGVIGAGIFLNPSIVAQRLGSFPLTLLAWALGAIASGAIAAVAVTFARYTATLAGRGAASHVPLGVAAIVLLSGW